MKQSQTTTSMEEPKTIVVCENCSQKLRIPKRKKKLRVTCPRCRHQFFFRHYAWGFSSSSKRPLLVGLLGSLIGFTVVEIIEASRLLADAKPVLGTLVVTGVFGACLGAIIGAASGYYGKDRDRLYYGLKLGSILGLISGVVSGVIAQLVFSAILSTVPLGRTPSLANVMLARISAWGILGLLIGLSYGIKENTVGDVKSGLIGGTIGGFVGGLLFDPSAWLISIGSGSLGRLIGFCVLGMAISVAISRVREDAIRRSRPEMHRQLTARLPANRRLMPPGSTSS